VYSQEKKKNKVYKKQKYKLKKIRFKIESFVYQFFKNNILQTTDTRKLCRGEEVKTATKAQKYHDL
jgi:hypothetical protein